MCSILGGNRVGVRSAYLYEQAKSRGRDLSNLVQIRSGLWIANHRAIPTTELEYPKHNQPFKHNDGYFVHNGVIANDKELGIEEGEIDSFSLVNILDVDGETDKEILDNLKDSLKPVEGSYAIAYLDTHLNEIFLACNYKPIWVGYFPDGEVLFSSLKEHFHQGWYGDGMILKRVPAYSVTSLTNFYKNNTIPLPRIWNKKRGLVIASGGLDSTVVATLAAKKGNHETLTLLHFMYGCRAEDMEVKRINQIAESLNSNKDIKCKIKVRFLSIDMSFASDASSLLNEEDTIAEGVAGTEYAHEWVPARNLVMLSMATAFAEANHYGTIYLGTNLEEGGAYPDNEEQFIEDFRNLLWGAVQNGLEVKVETPLGGLMKHEIVKVGKDLGAPLHLTHSCYQNGEHPCEDCGPCFMRTTAFERNDLVDPLLLIKRGEKYEA